MTDVSIIITTYRRPYFLRKAADSCLAQDNSLNLDRELIIVDNCPDRSARDTVAEIAAAAAIPVSYVSESNTNLAAARNAGIAAAASPLLIFFDDDQEIDPHCVDHLVSTQRRFQADAVIGAVLPVFEEGTPPRWYRVVNHCRRWYDWPTGTRIPDGRTGNSLVTRDTAVLRDPPFDLAFGHTGSEDLDFYMHLAQAGKKVLWCGEAVAHEFVGKERVRLSYVLRRLFRECQGLVRCHVRHSTRPVLTAVRLMARGGVQLGLWILPALILAPFDFPLAVRAKINVARGIGKLFWTRRFRLEFYKPKQEQAEQERSKQEQTT